MNFGAVETGQMYDVWSYETRDYGGERDRHWCRQKGDA
jgi:hypothetical protein